MNFKDTVPIICVEFQDRLHSQDIQFMNQKYLGIGNSVKSYWKEISYNRYDFPGEIFGWFKLQHTRDWYYNTLNTVNGSNVTEQKIAYDALSIMEKNIGDMSRFDKDNDGTVEYFCIVVSGTEFISTSTIYQYPKTTYGNVNWNNFAYLCEYYSTPNQVGQIGLDCHELGHVFGLVDLYKCDFPCRNNQWTLMSHGSSNCNTITPSHLNAYQKYVIGWINNSEIIRNPNGHVTLNNIEQNPKFVILDTHRADLLYFIEYRRAIGYDSCSPVSNYFAWDGQILIWLFYSKTYDNCQYNPCCKYELRGLYPSDGISFSPTTIPNNKVCDGVYPNFTVSNINVVGDTASFDVSTTYTCNLPKCSYNMI